MEHLPTIIVAAVVFGAFLAVIIRGILKKRSGKSGCGCGCDSCAGKSLCHPDES